MQSFQISGVIIIFTPQDLVEMVVKKAVNMAKRMEKPLLGVVENMAFGKSRAKEMSRITSAPLLRQIPVDPELARLCDEGNIEGYNSDNINALGESLVKAISSIKN